MAKSAPPMTADERAYALPVAWARTVEGMRELRHALTSMLALARHELRDEIITEEREIVGRLLAQAAITTNPADATLIRCLAEEHELTAQRIATADKRAKRA